MALTPLYNYLLIERLPPEPFEGNAGKLITVNRDPNAPKYAVVVAVGPGRTSEFGIVFPQPVKVGDLVLTYPHPGTPHKVDDRDLWFIRPEDILAVVTKDEATEPSA
jgi:chaperonin GroES